MQPRRRAILWILALMASVPAASSPATIPGPGGSQLSPISFAALPGWAQEDHAEAFAAFRLSCAALVDGTPALRPGLPPPEALRSVCADAQAVTAGDAQAARRFLETRFRPWHIEPSQGKQGFVTGYYEPVIDASLTANAEFRVPVLARPHDLETFAPGRTPPDLDPALAAARRTATGHEPFPDRAAIEDGALAGQGLELAWLRDEVELFLAQVQGSARLRLPDGSVRRLVYAGRNGLPYTSIGRQIVAEGHMRLDDMSLETLKAWLRAHPAQARRIMRLNRSYIFFAFGEGLDPEAGPLGAASVPLMPLRSIAIDRNLWPYGLPFVVEAELPGTQGGLLQPFQRLMLAHDTGSAIIGPARADLFMGTGDAAGAWAGRIRHQARLFVLLPQATAP